MAVKKATASSASSHASAAKKAAVSTKNKSPLKSASKTEKSLPVTAAHLKLAGVVDTPPPSFDDLGVPQLFPLDALDKIRTSGPAGTVFRLDGGFLDALRVQARRIETSDGQRELWLSFKVAGPSRDEFEKRLEKKGAKPGVLKFFEAEPKKKGPDVVLRQTGKTQDLGTSFYTHVQPGTSKAANATLTLTEGSSVLEYVPSDGPASLRGFVRLRLQGDDAAAKKSLKALIEKAGLHPVFAPTTELALKRYALMRLLWHVAPERSAKLAGQGPLSDLKISAITKELEAEGVSAARMKALHYREVAPGHFTVMDPVGLTAMKKAGLRFAYSTVSTPEHVLSILRDGQKATMTRWEEGMLVSGMSSMADLGSGGGQGVFSRLVTASADGESWTGRTYKIILKPEQLARLDIWGWPGDHYGRSWDLSEKNFGVELVKSVGGTGKSYEDYNEIISPVGNGPDFIHCVVATDAESRKTLISHLKKSGFKPPKGKTLESFVKLVKTIDADLVG